MIDVNTLMITLAGVLKRSEHAKTYTLNYVGDMGAMSFEQQAEWAHKQDILITPHGAQNVNFLWLKQCAVVMEIFPANYYMPGHLLQLAKAAGAVTFSAYPGIDPYKDISRTMSDAPFRISARSKNIYFDAVAAEVALNIMIKARKQCHKRTMQGAPHRKH